MTADESELAACLQALPGGPFALEAVVGRRQNSVVHRARAPGGCVAVKQCFAPGTHMPDAAAASREYQALVRLAAAATTVGLPAPAPLLLCPHAGAYVMSWIPGVPLTARLLASRTAASDAHALGRRAGAWLLSFHALHPLPARRPDFAGANATMDDLATNAGHAEPVLIEARGILNARAGAAAAADLPASWIHGDMKSDNLLVDGATLTGLDIHLAHDNTVIHDLAPFLNHLTLLRWSARGVLRARALRAAASGFVAGYGATAATWALPLAWLRGYLYAQPLARLAQDGSPRHWLLRAALRAELRGVLRGLAAA